MFFLSLIPILLSTVLAETPPGFSPNVTAHLDVIYGSTYITPGLSMSKAAVAALPTIGTSNDVLDGIYIYVMLDLDVPAQYTGGPAGSRGTNLHGLLTGFKSSGKTENGTHVLSTTDTGPASYLSPGPPAETPPHPHKYLELLFSQPASFAVPASMKSAVSNRLGFNITQFAAAAGLAAPIRANWFTVTGT